MQTTKYTQLQLRQVQGYSPLGSADFKKATDPVLLENDELKRIAAKHGKSPAQIALKWATQRGTVALPKSVNPARLAQNIAIFDFELDADDMTAINALDQDFHYLRPNDWYQVCALEIGFNALLRRTRFSF
jgi:alcohol dehydrogenase (NADP+)